MRHTVTVEIEVSGAQSPKDATRMIAEAVYDRIDSWILRPQCQAHVVSVGENPDAKIKKACDEFRELSQEHKPVDAKGAGTVINEMTGYPIMGQEDVKTLTRAQAILERFCYFSIAKLVGEVIEEEW